MTKISFDVDFSKDPDQILKEIQERAKAEVEKRESKERSAAYLSNLHESVNDKIGTEFKSVSDLIRALTPFAAPSLRDKLSGTTSTGRRKTLSMNKDIYEDIKKLLAEPNSNKAAIARETGASVVQVRKVAEGGFDSKYSGELSSSSEKPALGSPALAPPPILDDEPAANEGIVDEMPAPPSIKVNEAKSEESASTEEDSVPESTDQDSPPALPSFGDEDSEEPLAPPPIPFDVPSSAITDLAPPSNESESDEDTSEEILPPLPKFTPAPFVSDEEDSGENESNTPAPLPSFGEEEEDSPLPPPAPLSATPTPDPVEKEDEGSSESEDILPPLPKFTPAPFESEEEDSGSTEEPAPPPLPSFGQENNGENTSLPPPAPLSVDPPPVPDLPPVQSLAETDDSPEEIPPSPEEDNSVPPTPPPMASTPPPAGLTRPPSGLKPTLKPKLGGGKKGKPTLSLKPKSKTTGLKITRPPMKGNPPPSQ